MRRCDILRMWSQIVQQTGIHKYTSAEWQEHYEDFWRCMKSNSDPYIRIESIDHSLNNNVEFKDPPQSPELNSTQKRKSQAKARQEPAHNVDESEPLSMLRKRMKTDAEARMAANDSKLNEDKTPTGTKTTITEGFEDQKTTALKSPKNKSKISPKKSEAPEETSRAQLMMKKKAQEKQQVELEERMERQEVREKQQDKVGIVLQYAGINKKMVKEEQLTQKAQENQQNQLKENLKKQKTSLNQQDQKIEKKAKLPKTQEEQDAEQEKAQQKQLEELLQKINLPKIEMPTKRERKKKRPSKRPVKKAETKANKKEDTIESPLKEEPKNKKPQRVRTRSQRSESIEHQQQKQEQKQQQQEGANQEQIQNTQNTTRCKLKRQSRAMLDDIEQAHMPPTAIDLRTTAAAAAAPAPISDIVPLSDNKSIILPQAENLTMPKSSTTIEKYEEQERKLSLSEASDDSGDLIEVDKPAEPVSEANLEDMLVKEAIQLAAQTDLGQLLAEDTAKQEPLESGIEEIDRCLQSFNNKTPSEIDHQIADTTDFFENLPNLSTIGRTPLELEALMNNELIYDAEDDDDDDVISVATSWDGDDDNTMDANAAKQPLKTAKENAKVAQTIGFKESPKNDQQSMTAVTVAATAEPVATATPAKQHLNELLKYRIPKKNVGPPEIQPKILQKPPQVEKPILLGKQQQPIMRNKQQQQPIIRNQQQPIIKNQQQHPISINQQQVHPQQHLIFINQQQQLSKQQQLQSQQYPVVRNQQQPQQQANIRNQMQQIPTQHQLQSPQHPLIRNQQQQGSIRNQQQQLPTQSPQHPLIRNQQTEHEQQNLPATAAGAAQAVPMFAPPYRRPADQIVSAQSGIPNIYRNQECRLSIFGVKCWRILDGHCDQINCNHTLSSMGDVQRRLGQLKPDQLCDTYYLMLRHGILFRNYFIVFAEIFGHRNMRTHLMKMVEDCSLYVAHCASFISDIYYMLLRFKVTPQKAIAHLMEHLWRPNIGLTYPQLAGQLLNLLSVSDWFNYIPSIKHLFDQQGFPIPTDFLKTIASDAVAKDEPGLVQKVWELVLFSPIDRNDDTLSVVIKILQNWRGSAEGQLQQQQRALPQSYVNNLRNSTNLLRQPVEDNIGVNLHNF